MDQPEIESSIQLKSEEKPAFILAGQIALLLSVLLTFGLATVAGNIASGAQAIFVLSGIIHAIFIGMGLSLFKHALDKGNNPILRAGFENCGGVTYRCRN